jgi:pyruvate/2-oxoglutarate dehydrogenase complex dihydrolipoamide dehydrogenase (E3) component
MARFGGLGVQVVTGTAAFRDRATVTVGDDYEIQARAFVIATGSVPAVPSIAGLAEAGYFTGDTVFDLAQCPAHLVVIGAGSTGLALAQAYRRLGATVTVLEAAAPLAGEDPEIAAVVLDRLAREGVTVRAGVRIARIEGVTPSLRIVLDAGGTEEVVTSSHLLLAAGRCAAVLGLGLEAAGITHDADGIPVDARLRTTNRRVYAIGDVVRGAARSVHGAEHQAGLVVRQTILGKSAANVTEAVPRVTHTTPELAHVGLHETEAKARLGAVRILRWPFNQNDRALAEGEPHGHVKVVASVKGDILGATIVGPQAGELIALWALAIGQKLGVDALIGTAIPYPSLSEAGRMAAGSYYLSGLTVPRLRRMIGMLRWFG